MPSRRPAPKSNLKAQPNGLTHIKDLVPDPANRRQHNPRNVGMIADALREVGAARSIVIDEDNVILAGNGVIDAAAEAGITRLRVIEADGEEVIAVRRAGLTAEQKRALAIYDNRTAELATWNLDQLLADVGNGLALQPWWTPEEEALLLKAQAKQGRTDPDAVPAERATDIQRGDLFELGAHRLLCGDSTNSEDVARVMDGARADFSFTDPPYNVNMEYTAETNDNLPRDSFVAWCQRWATHLPRVHCLTVGIKRLVWWGDILGDPQWIIAWVKRNGQGQTGLGGTNKWDAILCYGVPLDRDVDVIEINNDYREGVKAKGDHPTAKPVELWTTVIGRFGGALMYEPFLGSGTTVIACEQLSRQCRAIEIGPRYVQVAIDRWEAFTGQKARKVGEAIRA
jgi:DNA methylase